MPPPSPGDERDRRADRAEIEIAEPVVGAPREHLLRELALRVEQLVDALLERAEADQAVHEHRLALADAMHAVGRLLLDGRVPPAVEVEDVIRRRQVQTAAACADRDDEHRRPVLARERGQQLLALPRVEPAVEEADLAVEPLAQIRDEAVEARVLREDERLVGARHVGEQLDEALELARARVQRLRPCARSISG